MSTTEMATPKKQLVALVKDAAQKRQKIQSISGEIGERIKHAVENAHLNRGAFGLIRRLFSMEEDKRNDFLRAFEIYRDYCTEEGLFSSEHTGDLVDQAEADSDLDSDAAHVAANTAALEKGIKPLPESDAGFDDQTSSKPSRKRAAPMEGADAAGSYKIN